MKVSPQAFFGFLFCPTNSGIFKSKFKRGISKETEWFWFRDSRKRKGVMNFGLLRRKSLQVFISKLKKNCSNTFRGKKLLKIRFFLGEGRTMLWKIISGVMGRIPLSGDCLEAIFSLFYYSDMFTIHLAASR